MGRKIGDKLKVLLDDDLTKAFMLVKIGPFYDGDYTRETTDHGDVLFNNENYIAQSTLVRVDTPKITSGIDKAAYKLSFIDTNYFYREKFRHGITGTKAELRAMFIDVAGHFDKGQPLLEPENTLIIYKGIVNGTNLNAGSENLPIAEIELASPMGALTMVRGLITSQDWIRQKYPTDTSFDNIHEGSKQIILGWGKK